MKRSFWKSMVETCAAMEWNMGLDIGHLIYEDEREKAPRA